MVLAVRYTDAVNIPVHICTDECKTRSKISLHSVHIYLGMGFSVYFLDTFYQ